LLRAVVVTLGAGLTITVTDAEALGLTVEVAVTDTLKAAVTVAGALYVAEFAVTFVKVPQAAPVHDPDALQVTPEVEPRVSTLALKSHVCP
jgi:hypothetical protein